MDNQSQFFYSSIFKISISPKNYHFSSLDWAFKLICEKFGFTHTQAQGWDGIDHDYYKFYVLGDTEFGTIQFIKILAF